MCLASGTGTLAGNPEIRHRLQVEELTRQAAAAEGDSCGGVGAAGCGWAAGVFDLLAGGGGV